MSAVLPEPATGAVPDSANERLARSRERMTRWLADDQQSTRAAASNVPAWLNKLRQNPVSAIAVDALLAWWERQPLNTSVHVAEAAASAAITPLVRRHPVVVLGGAAVAGAAVVWARPWRWLLSRALLTGIAAQLATRLIAHSRKEPPAK